MEPAGDADSVPALHELPALARYGEKRDAQILVDAPEVRMVLFSLQAGQRVGGRGEPRVQMICIEGDGQLWAGERTVPARAGTMIGCAAGEAHGAQAGDGRFLVLGVITPRP
ncbi:MAG: cupin [Jiangellaceae bacterium]